MALDNIKDFFSTRYTHPWGTMMTEQKRSVVFILKDEKKHGLDLEAQFLPVFLNIWECIKATLWLMLWIGVEGRAAYLYVRNPEESFDPGILFMVGMTGMVLYAMKIITWYPLMRTKVNERKVRRYVKIQKWLRRFCLVVNLIISLTPFWCCLFAEKLSDYGKLHGWEPCGSRYDYESNGGTMGMVTFLCLTSLVLMIWILTDSFGSEKSIRQRLCYLNYRIGATVKDELKRQEDIFRKMELLKIKRKEIACLEDAIANLEKEIANLKDK